MTSVARDRSCRDSRLLGAYLDGELDGATLLEIEGHLPTCDVCQERVELDKSMRGTLKNIVRGPMHVGGSVGGAARPGLDALRARA